MGQAFSGQQAGSNATPPPIPNAASYFVAVNGQQTGPFTMNILKEMALKNELTRETLVWKQGMSQWQAAGEQSDLSGLFGSVPPPIPK